MKKLILFTFLLFLSTHRVLAQTKVEKLKIASLENKTISLTIQLNMATEKITIFSDSINPICINGYKELETDIKIINKKFTAIHFKIAGGSGVKLRRYILLCVSNNKIYNAFDVLADVTNLRDTTFYDRYNLCFTKMSLTNNSYRLICTEEERKKNGNKNVGFYTDTLQFQFDNSKRIFYNAFDTLSGKYTVEQDIISRAKELDFSGSKFPPSGLSM